MSMLMVLLFLVILLFGGVFCIQLKKIHSLEAALRQIEKEKGSCLLESEKLRDSLCVINSKNQEMNIKGNNLFKVYKDLKNHYETLESLHNKVLEESVPIKNININLVDENTIIKEKHVNLKELLESSSANIKEKNIEIESLQLNYNKIKQDYNIASEVIVKNNEVHCKLVIDNNNNIDQLNIKTEMCDMLNNDNSMYKKNSIVASNKILHLESEIQELKIQNEDLIRYVGELEDEHTVNESNELESLLNKRKEIEEEIYHVQRDVATLKDQLRLDKMRYNVVENELATIRKESSNEIDKFTYIKSMAKGAGKHLESLCAVSGRRTVTQIKKLCRICENTPSMPGDDLCMDCARNT